MFRRASGYEKDQQEKLEQYQDCVMNFSKAFDIKSQVDRVYEEALQAREDAKRALRRVIQ